MQTTPPLPSTPSHPYQNPPKKSNGLITASFIIGIVLLVLNLVYSSINPYLLRSLLARNLKTSAIVVITMTISVFFGFIGLLGLLLGILGFRQLVRGQPPIKYFLAVSGIALCFHSALSILGVLANLISSFLFEII